MREDVVKILLGFCSCFVYICLLNYLNMKDIRYVDDKTASTGLEMVLIMGTKLNVD